MVTPKELTGQKLLRITLLYFHSYKKKSSQQNKGELLDANIGFKQNKQLPYLPRTLSLTASRENHVIGFCCILQKFIAN